MMISIFGFTMAVLIILATLTKNEDDRGFYCIFALVMFAAMVAANG
ncbi:MAG: hypothetical protein U5N55_11910 [Cypionkella sp.]|nr:hypothetical protein [Cypionkella sp.]